MRKALMMIFVVIWTGMLLQFSVGDGFASEKTARRKSAQPPFINGPSAWSDSVYKTMTPEERIGQLFMVASYPQDGDADKSRVADLIKKYNIGGVIFFQGTPSEVQELTQFYQSLSKVPLFFAIDGEWGASMRLENMIRYPRQMMLGAIRDDDIIYDMGHDIALQLHALGIHINFAPVADVNNNPDNPVINSRSFGEVRENVARKSALYMQGMQDEGIIAVAKHFPGHGDTDRDSHLGLPVINHPQQRIDSIELYPFKELIRKGVGGIMIAHLSIAQLDTTPNLPSTLSAAITDTLLRQKMHFNGLIFTDAMNMKGVADLYDPVDANIMAINAGNDILIMPEDIEKTFHKVSKLVEKGEMDVNKINERCKRILRAKEWAVVPRLSNKQPTGSHLIDELNTPEFELRRRTLIENSITLVENKIKLIPFHRLDTLRVVAVSLGGEENNIYHQTLMKYAGIDTFQILGNEDGIIMKRVFDTLKYYNLVLLSIHSNDIRARQNFGVSTRLLEFADAILYRYPVVLNAFSNPYLLAKLDYLSKNKALIVSYENDPAVQSLSAQMLFGAIGAKGRLPVSISSSLPAGKGIDSEAGIRLKYTIPLEAGFDEVKLQLIDTIIKNAINNKAMPGCQVLVARNNKVIFQKSFGYHDYRKTTGVQNTDLYDIASVTKAMATAPALMMLEQNGLINVDDKLSKYYPALESTNKSKIRIDEILLHQAGLVAWIPFYAPFLAPIYPEQSFSKNKFSLQYPFQYDINVFVNKDLQYETGSFSKTYSKKYSVQVADGLFMNPSLKDSLLKAIFISDVKKPGEYLYSDLGFYLLCEMTEQLTGKTLDHLVDSCFYKPLGAWTLGYNPSRKFSKDVIVPTENDLIFRRQIVHGFVHDPGAAMMGGVSGHAGLFSNANDLAKMMQMYLNGGTYGGDKFLNKKEIEKFTSCVACKNNNRRGLVFDKPSIDPGESGPTIQGISPDSYGHTGFTGTMVWADPSTGIVYIFLSNRIYPDANNKKLVEMNVRTDVQQAVYNALIDE